MKVLIENTLKELKEELQGLQGYDIYEYNQYNYPTDVIIYETETLAKEIQGYQEKVRNGFLNHVNQRNRGILLISARNKTIQEIEAILEKRYREEVF